MTGSKNHCWLSVTSMTHNFAVVVNVLLPSCSHIGWSMSYLCIFVEETVTLLGAITKKMGVKLVVVGIRA